MKHIDIKKFAEKKTCIVLTTILFIILSILYTVIDKAYLNQYFNLVIYPAGYENQGECILDNNYIKPKEEREIYIGYNVSEAILASEKREKVLKHDIMFCLKAYPVRQAIVFKGIEGYEEDK